MKCVAISDTHGMHWDIEVPDGDVLIHAGDALGQGNLENIQDLNSWLGTLPHQHKILVAGNHDFEFQKNPEQAREAITSAIYLEDEGIEIDGVKFYGSPWQPWFLDWAFNLQRGEEIKQKWDLIPDQVDVLITHGPPHKILDKTVDGLFVGCEELTKSLERIQPKFHVFGHIHEGYGTEENNGCTFINASINNDRYKPTNSAIVFEV